jgi:methyl-accepting chemotaxis protein
MKKQLKLKDLLSESTICLGLVGTPAINKPFSWAGQLKEDDAEDLRKKNLIFGQKEDEEQEVSPEMKKAFLELVQNYSSYADDIYRERKLKDITEMITQIGQLAEKIALSNTEDWFDTMSVQRDMKNLAESVKLFEKTAKDISVLQQRLESLFEDIGQKLSRYYDVNQQIANEIKESKKKHSLKK